MQGDLERAIRETVGQAVDVIGCGRTDAGVHAAAYVANFAAESRLPPERLQAALNSRLGEDVVITSCEVVAEGFNARADALAKVYRYTTVFGDLRPVLRRGFVNYASRGLDVEAMREAARALVGEHDFAGFVNQLEEGKNTVRRLFAVAVESEGTTVTLTFTGNGFLYNMVRILAGTLIEVGRGKYPPEWVGEALATRDRTATGPTAPAKGLMLMKVIYDESRLNELLAGTGGA